MPGTPAPTRPTGRVGALGWSLAWLAIALGIGVAVGFVGGLLARVVIDPSDPWSDLVAVVLGVLAGVFGAMTVWFVAMALATRRFVPAGRRVGVLGWSALAVVASPLLVGALFTVIGASSAPRGFVVLTALLAMAIAPPALIAARVPGTDPVLGTDQVPGAEPGEEPSSTDGSMVP